MPIPSWASQALPQVPQKGFSESLGLNIIRSNPDAGPAKMRRKGTRVNTMDLSFIMTTAQCATLETFIEDTLLSTTAGALKLPKSCQYYRTLFALPLVMKT